MRWNSNDWSADDSVIRASPVFGDDLSFTSGPKSEIIQYGTISDNNNAKRTLGLVQMLDQFVNGSFRVLQSFTVREAIHGSGGSQDRRRSSYPSQER
jgi:hypothetical protein